MHLSLQISNNVIIPLSEITLSIDRSIYRVNEGDESVSVKVVVTGKTAVAIAGRYIIIAFLVTTVQLY
jgi:hypothetical protein